MFENHKFNLGDIVRHATASKRKISDLSRVRFPKTGSNNPKMVVTGRGVVEYDLGVEHIYNVSFQVNGITQRSLLQESELMLWQRADTTDPTPTEEV